MLIVGGADRYIKLYRVWDMWQLKIMENDTVSYDLALSPDGRLLTAGSLDSPLQIWSIPEGKEVGRLVGNKGAILELAFSPDGKPLLSTGLDGTVRLWGIQP